MSWENFLNDLKILELVKLILFVALFAFSTSYLLPKGIISFLEWKKNKVDRQLITGITFCSGGVMILIYLLASLITSHVKVIFG